MIKEKIIRILGFFIARLFYKKEFIKGEYFEKNYIGWIWIIKCFIPQKILRINSSAPFPVSPFVKLTNGENIIFGKGCLNNFQSRGLYLQCYDSKIILGNNVFIAPNVGIITQNHDVNDIRKHVRGKDVIIGDNCWVGMNSIILPGVKLGNNVIVGAGSVVTKSFDEDNITVAGNPAVIISRRTL